MDLNSPLYDIQSAFSFLFFLLSAKDRIYNQVCEEMVAMGSHFTSYFSDATVRKQASVITQLLWYLDGSTNHGKERTSSGNETYSREVNF